MRLLVLNYEYPPLGGGGGRFTAELCRRLAQMGHDIRLQTGYGRGLPRLEVRDGITIMRHSLPRRAFHTCSVKEMGLFLLGAFVPALRQVLTWQPQVLHVHFAVPTGVLGFFLHCLTGIPYVLSTQLGDIPGGVPLQTDHLFKWLKPFTVPIWKAAARITVPSGQTLSLAQQSYPGLPVEVVYNGMNLAGQPLSSAAAGQPVRLIFAGRFSPQKNLLQLVQALQQVRDLPWRLEMLGDGPLRPVLKEAVEAGALGSQVHFHGWVSPEQVAATMSQGDILLLPSLSEGLPLVGVQALAAGLAIVGSDIGGLGELVRPGYNGFLCPIDDVASFAAALRTLLTTDGLVAKMKAESRRRAELFDIRKIARRFADIFESVVQQP